MRAEAEPGRTPGCAGSVGRTISCLPDQNEKRVFARRRVLVERLDQKTRAHLDGGFSSAPSTHTKHFSLRRRLNYGHKCKIPTSKLNKTHHSGQKRYLIFFFFFLLRGATRNSTTKDVLRITVVKLRFCQGRSGLPGSHRDGGVVR